MSPADFSSLKASMVRVNLARGDDLSLPGVPVENCWFLEDGIASMVAITLDGKEAEAGIVGREGMIDVATILGVALPSLRCFMQVPGHGFRLPARVLAAAYEASPTLRTQLNPFAYRMLAQIAQTALANASFTIQERLARWLLMCSDRLGTEDVHLTHEFLALMLGVRRAGITVALQSLSAEGLVQSTRGSVRITDRSGLERFGSAAYTSLT